MNSGSSPHLLYRHGFFFVLRCDFGWSSCRLRRNVCTNGSLQTPQPNFCSTQVADLVDFQLSVKFSALFENPANLVRGDGINAAAERYQLYQLEIRLCCDILGSPIHSGVICPLVECLQFRCVCESGNAVLGNDCHAKAADELVDAVVDFRVNVVCQREPKSFFQLLLPAGQFPVQSEQFGCGTVREPQIHVREPLQFLSWWRSQTDRHIKR